MRGIAKNRHRTPTPKNRRNEMMDEFRAGMRILDGRCDWLKARDHNTYNARIFITQ